MLSNSIATSSPFRVTTGFFAIRRQCLQGVELAPLGFKIGLECFVKAGWESYSEIPFSFSDRLHGQSKLGGGEVFAYLRHLLRLYLYRASHRQRRQ